MFALLAGNIAYFTSFYSFLIREPLHISVCLSVWFWVPVLPCLTVETGFHGFVILKSSFNFPSVGCIIMFLVGRCQVFITLVGSKLLHLGWEIYSVCKKIWHQAGSESKVGTEHNIQLCTKLTGILNPATDHIRLQLCVGLLAFFLCALFDKTGRRTLIKPAYGTLTGSFLYDQFNCIPTFYTSPFVALERVFTEVHIFETSDWLRIFYVFLLTVLALCPKEIITLLWARLWFFFS